MTFTEAARIMMTKNLVIKPLTITSNGEYTVPTGVDGYNPILVNVPKSSGGIWDMFDGREPLAIITLGPNTQVYVLDMGVPFGSSIGYENHGQYVTEENIFAYPYAVLRHNNRFIAYYSRSQMGDYASKRYTLIGDRMLMTFHRQVKFGATKVTQCSFSKSGNRISFTLTMKQFLDYLNFQQYDYDDGSHWEETYAWYNGPHSYDSYFSFEARTISSNYTYNYVNNVLGDTLSEQSDIWNSVSEDVVKNAGKGYPIISYTKPEDHFESAFYTNETAINKGYYDTNAAYMEKWGTPELWA